MKNFHVYGFIHWLHFLIFNFLLFDNFCREEDKDSWEMKKFNFKWTLVIVSAKSCNPFIDRKNKRRKKKLKENQQMFEIARY